MTVAGLSALKVVTFALILAVFSARPELFVAALPVVLALALTARRRAIPSHDVSHHVSADRLMEGEGFRVTVTVTAQDAIPLLEVFDVVPRDCEVVAGHPRALMALRRGQSASFTYEVHVARGVHDFGPVITRARDRWALRAWEQHHGMRARVRVHPKVAPLRTLPRPLHTQTSVGDYVSAALGDGLEPGDIRQFAPGDRIRQVNWRASLRLGALYVTRHQRERNADVVLMLDTLADAGATPNTALDFAVRAAASLASAYLARKDRVGLICYGGTIDWVKPGTGRIQYERVVDTLLRATVVFTYVSKDLALVPPRVLPAQALIVAVTPLLDARFVQAALDLAGRGFDLVVVAVSAVDVTRSVVGDSPVDALACRLWTLERRARIDLFRRQGIAVLEWSPSDPLELALAPHGRRRARVVAAG